MKENKIKCRSLIEAKKHVKDLGFHYVGHDNYKENKIMYYKKGRVTLIITAEPSSFLNKDSMDIGTNWFVQKWV